MKNIFHIRQSTRVKWTKTDEEHEELFTQQQAQIKQGWSLLATLHCVLLPDKVNDICLLFYFNDVQVLFL